MSAPDQLYLYNALSGKKERFQSLFEKKGGKPTKAKDGRPLRGPVGMYVCGPTVYSDVHLGNVRTFMTFDVLYRYLKHLGYEVRYVRNITDVGHLTDEDTDQGEDKMEKAARLAKKEPMEIAHHYIRRFHKVMEAFNIEPPNLEPQATGHIPEQIELIQTLLKKGYAYEAKGNVYFDLEKYRHSHDYGRLSGRKVEELYAGTRALTGEGKRNPLDFALWKRAEKGRLMWWNSPWGKGVPGWHLECSAMSKRYLGEQFDIHGGGMDLKFPHHECERAQCAGADGKNASAQFWLYSNMLTMDGKKMSKSTGNFVDVWGFIDLRRKDVVIKGLIKRSPYLALALRLLMLQAHYRSTLDYSHEALASALNTYLKLIKPYSDACRYLSNIAEAVYMEPKFDPNSPSWDSITRKLERCYENFTEAMSDDLNTAEALAALFEMNKVINTLPEIAPRDENLSKKVKKTLENCYIEPFELLGLNPKDDIYTKAHDVLDKFIQTLTESYLLSKIQAKTKKDYTVSDYLRQTLEKAGVQISEGKNRIRWIFQTGEYVRGGYINIEIFA